MSYRLDPAWRNHFWGRVAVAADDECWPWIGAATGGGYGSLRYMRGHLLAHRVAYELTHGIIEPGRVVMHSCDNPRCCNPWHLSSGTPADNISDRTDKGRGYAHDGKRNKLTLTDVLAIHDRRAGGEQVQDIAASIGIHPVHCSQILRGRFWPGALTIWQEERAPCA